MRPALPPQPGKMQAAPAESKLRAGYCLVLIPVVDLTGGPPGSCAIVLVRDDTSPLCTLVWVIDFENVPPSCAWPCAWALRLPLFPPFETLLLTFWCETPAALAPAPMVDEPPDVPPVPSEDAEVPPTAALPPVPPVAAPCAKAREATEAVNAPARTAVLSALMLFLLVAVDGATAV